MLGVIVNTLTVAAGSLFGRLIGGKLPEKYFKAAMTAIGLVTIYLGISGMMKSENTLVLILSVVFGVVSGTLLKLDERVTRLGEFIEKRFSVKRSGSIAKGFVTASLLFCVGAMTVTGSIQSGTTGDNSLIYTKSLLDLVSATVLSATLGWGVLLSALFVLVFQGALVLLSGLLAGVLTVSAVAEMTSAGSAAILAIGLDLTGIVKIKAADFLPAIVFAVGFNSLFEWINALAA